MRPLTDLARNKANKILVKYAQEGNLIKVKEFLDGGVSARSLYSRGLRRAVKYGHFEVAKVLLKDGAELGSNKNECLWVSAQKGYLNIFRYLLQWKDIKGGRDDNSWCYKALSEACANGHLKIIKILLNFFIVPKVQLEFEFFNCMLKSIQSGHVEIFESLHSISRVKRGTISMHDKWWKNDRQWKSIDFHLVYHNRLSMLQYLIQNNFMKNLNPNSNYLLGVASRRGHLEMVQYLLSGDNNKFVKAEINAYNIHMHPTHTKALWCAKRRRKEEIVRYLISQGAVE